MDTFQLSMKYSVLLPDVDATEVDNSTDPATHVSVTNTSIDRSLFLDKNFSVTLYLPIFFWKFHINTTCSKSTCYKYNLASSLDSDLSIFSYVPFVVVLNTAIVSGPFSHLPLFLI